MYGYVNVYECGARLQPGALDEGEAPHDAVARLAGFVKLKRLRANRIDAAVASVNDGLAHDARKLTGLGRLAGIGDVVVDEGTEVAKVGRTTGLTHGRVTAFELDNVVVGYDLGVAAQRCRTTVGALPACDTCHLRHRNPFGVGYHPRIPPRVGAERQPWAMPRNAFGVPRRDEGSQRGRSARREKTRARRLSQAGPRRRRGITKVDDGYAVKVNLSEKPGPRVALPDTIDGVPSARRSRWAHPQAVSVAKPAAPPRGG